jgi:hypothetical protein
MCVRIGNIAFLPLLPLEVYCPAFHCFNEILFRPNWCKSLQHYGRLWFHIVTVEMWFDTSAEQTMARSVLLSSVLLFCSAGRDLDNSLLKPNRTVGIHQGNLPRAWGIHCSYGLDLEQCRCMHFFIVACELRVFSSLCFLMHVIVMHYFIEPKNVYTFYFMMQLQRVQATALWVQIFSLHNIYCHEKYKTCIQWHAMNDGF